MMRTPLPRPWRLRHAALIVASAAVAGCLVGPKYARPPVEQPATFKSASPGGDQVANLEEWWRLYRDPELDGLIATANASNQTLRQAVARVDAARSLARVAASYRYPAISLAPSASPPHLSGNRASTVPGQPVPGARTAGGWRLP